MDDDSDFEDEQLGSPNSNQGGTVLSDDHKRHARAQHNALERRRRDNIKDMYISLKDAVPDMQNERASRAVILRRAIEVIEEKQRENAELHADCNRIREEAAEMEREIKKMREALQASHNPLNSSAPITSTSVKVDSEATIEIKDGHHD